MERAPSRLVAKILDTLAESLDERMAASVPNDEELLERLGPLLEDAIGDDHVLFSLELLRQCGERAQAVDREAQFIAKLLNFAFQVVAMEWRCTRVN
jgi:hypothetical protein